MSDVKRSEIGGIRVVLWEKNRSNYKTKTLVFKNSLPEAKRLEIRINTLSEGRRETLNR